MLILSRKINESVMIDGCIEVKVVRLDGDVVRLGFVAPRDIPVHRKEVYEAILKNNRQALTTKRPILPEVFETGSGRSMPQSAGDPPAEAKAAASEATPVAS